MFKIDLFTVKTQGRTCTQHILSPSPLPHPKFLFLDVFFIFFLTLQNSGWQEVFLTSNFINSYLLFIEAKKYGKVEPIRTYCRSIESSPCQGIYKFSGWRRLDSNSGESLRVILPSQRIYYLNALTHSLRPSLSTDNRALMN